MTDPATLASSLLLQSPPGQVDAVYHDLSSISGVDASSFSKLAQKHLREYNEEQLIAVEGSVISKEARLDGGADEGRYVDQGKGISFDVDHKELKLKSTSPLGKPLASDATELRAELDKLLETYIADHFPDGARSVLVVGQNYEKESKVEEAVKPVKEEKEEAKAEKEGEEAEEKRADEEEEEGKSLKPTEQGGDADGDDRMASPAPGQKEEDEEAATSKAEDEVKPEPEAEAETEEPIVEPTKLVVHISGNKYSLANYWSGRWRSTYYITLRPSIEVTGRTSVQVHYFENGNVQLRTSTPLHPISLPSSTSASTAAAKAKALSNAIRAAEDAYEKDVVARTKEMGEGAFRGLRRTLPVTKQKMDWDKVLNYKLSTELGK